MVLAGNEPQPGATWKVTPGNGRRPMRVGMRLYHHGRTDSSAVSAVTGYADDPCSLHTRLAAAVNAAATPLSP